MLFAFLLPLEVNLVPLISRILVRFARMEQMLRHKCFCRIPSAWSALQKLQASRRRSLCCWYCFWNQSFFESRCPSLEACLGWQCWLAFWLPQVSLRLSRVDLLCMPPRVKIQLADHGHELTGEGIYKMFVDYSFMCWLSVLIPYVFASGWRSVFDVLLLIRGDSRLIAVSDV